MSLALSGKRIWQARKRSAGLAPILIDESGDELENLVLLASGQSSDLLKELLNTPNGRGLDGWSQRGGAWLGEQQLGADAENASELGDGA